MTRQGDEEREVKLAVDQAFRLPSLAGLGGGVTVTDSGERTTVSEYWDTEDLRLARAGVGLRHRDGVWTFKGESRRDGDAVVRQERELRGDGLTMPDELRRRAARWCEVGKMRVVVRLCTTRQALQIVEAQATVELVHDRVEILDGEQTVSRFAEVEVEFDSAGTALADRVVQLVRAHGAAVDRTPKYFRALTALGRRPPDLSE